MFSRHERPRDRAKSRDLSTEESYALIYLPLLFTYPCGIHDANASGRARLAAPNGQNAVTDTADATGCFFCSEAYALEFCVPIPPTALRTGHLDARRMVRLTSDERGHTIRPDGAGMVCGWKPIASERAN